MSSKTSTKVSDTAYIERLIELFDTDEPKIIQRKLGIDYQSAKNYLNGRKPKAEVLEIIAEKTGVSINWLLTGEGSKFISKEILDELTRNNQIERARQNDLLSLEEYLENYEEGDDLLVSPTQKMYLGMMEDCVIEIISKIVPPMIRNEIALANGEKLTAKKTKNVENHVLLNLTDETEKAIRQLVVQVLNDNEVSKVNNVKIDSFEEFDEVTKEYVNELESDTKRKAS